MDYGRYFVEYVHLLVKLTLSNTYKVLLMNEVFNNIDRNSK